MMHFQLDITLTEEDYLEFNYFHAVESASGKKQIRKNRILLASVFAILVGLVILMSGWNTFSATYAILMVLFTALYLGFYKNIIKSNIKAQIKALKKRGKLPFDATSGFAFYEDKLIETTPTSRTEQPYSALERICIVENRYIYLYRSSVGAYILPISQIKDQLDHAEFMGFISQKCDTVEHY